MNNDQPRPPGSPAHLACAAVLDRARGDLPNAAYEMWFAALAPGKTRGDVVELLAPNGYVKSWLSGHYMDLIGAAVTTTRTGRKKGLPRSSPLSREENLI